MGEDNLKKYTLAIEDYKAGVGKTFHQLLHHNVASALIGQDFQLFRNPYHICTGSLRSLYAYLPNLKEINGLLFQLQLHDDRKIKANHLYFEWLTNYSPYRDAFLTKDVSRMQKDKVVDMNVEMPFSYIIGAAMLMRHMWENYEAGYHFKNRIKLWTDMVKKGLDPNAVFTFVNCLFSEDQRYNCLYSIGYPNGHMILNKTSVKSHINFISDIRPDKPDGSFSSIGLSRQHGGWAASQFWGYNDDDDGNRWRKLVGEALKGGVEKKINPFKGTTSSSYSKDEVISNLTNFIPSFLKDERYFHA